MSTRTKRLASKEVMVAALAAAAVVGWRRATSRRAISAGPTPPPAPLPTSSREAATTAEATPELPVEFDESLSLFEEEPADLAVEPGDDERRLRVAYILTGLCLLVILVTGIIVWTVQPHDTHTASAPIISTTPSTPSSPSNPKTRRPHVVPNTAGPACPDADPCRITIKAISVDTSVAPKPTVAEWDPFLNKTVDSFGVPSDFTTTAWWSDGPRPGQPGMAIILGHHYDEGYGVFNNLGTLRSGNVIEIRTGKSVLDYQVDTIDGYLPKTDANALSDALSAHSNSEDLALISCTGPPDAASHQIGANLIVFARLIARAKVGSTRL